MTSKKSIFKRLCSCLLALSFIAAPVFAEETKNDSRALLQVEFLEALGVYDSDRTNMSETEDYLTRLDLAVILGGFFGFEPTAPVGAENVTGFLDIEADHWAAERIKAVADRKIMSGYSDGYFRPDNNATFEQAVKTLVVLAGHDIIADFQGGWSTGYLNVADQIGITDGVSLGLTEPIRKGQFTQMVVNLLEAELVKARFLPGGEIFYEETDDIFMNEVLDIYVQKGVMTANEQTALLGKSVANKGFITVGGISIKADGLYADYLGCDVKAYYKYDENENEGTLLWIEEGKKNSVLEFEGEDVVNPNSNGYFEYEEGSNINKIRIADILSLSVIYNGKLINFATYQDLVPENGTVKLIDAKGDGTFETAIVWNYYDFVVDSIIKQGDKISILDSRGYVNALDISLVDDYKVEVFKDGNLVDINSISSGSVLSVAVDSFTQDVIDTIGTNSNVIKLNSAYVKMVCSTESVVGTLKANNSKSYTIDSQVLYFSPHFDPTAEEIFTGVGITAYLNQNGKIVYVELTDGWRYGFVKKVAWLEENETVLIRIYTADGEFVDYQVNKIRVDGITRKDDLIISDLNSSGVLYQNETAPEGKANWADYNQMIKYFIKNSKLTEIDTIYPKLEKTDPNFDYKKFHITKNIASGGKEIDIGSGNAKVAGDEMFIYSKTAKYFIIPPDLNAVEDYSVHNIASARKNSSQRTLFDGDDFNTVPLVLEIGNVQEQVVFRDATNYDMIFEEKSYELNSDGYPTYILKGLSLPTGKAIEMELENEQVYDIYSEDELRPGDIVSWNQNLRGKATKIMRVYDGIGKKLDPVAKSRILVKQNFQEGYNIIDGTVIRKKGNYMLVKNSIRKGEGASAYEIPEEVLCEFSANGLVYVFESATKTLRMGSLSELRTEDKYGAEADKIFLKYQGYTPMRLVIYR